MTQQQMTKTINHLQDQLKGIRYGTITPALIDTIKINNNPIKHIAHTTTDHGRIMIKPYDPTTLNNINKTLQKTGFNSYIYSKEAICIPIPPPSEEQKTEIINHIKKIGEETKIAIRNIRKKAKQQIKNNKNQTEQQKLETNLQTLTDNAINTINKIIEHKIKTI